MASVLSRIQIIMEANAANYNNELRRARQHSQSTFGKISKAAGKMALGVGTGLVAMGAKSLQTAGQFESAMNGVKAVSGATGKEFTNLRDTAKELGSTTAYSATEAANGMEYLAMAGMSTEQVLSTIPNALNLASAGGIELAQSADILSNVLTGMGLAAEDSGRAADVLAATAAGANVDIAMLGDSMKFAAPIAKQLGLSLEETAATIGVMGNAGIQGSMAGTALRAVYTRLATHDKAKAHFKALGIEIADSNGKMKSMVDIFKELEVASKDMTAQEKLAMYKDTVGAEAMSAFGVTIDSVTDGSLSNLINKLETSEGAAKKMADIKMEGLQGSFKGLASAWEGLQIQLADGGALSLAAAAVNAVADGLRGLTEHLPEIIANFQAFSESVGIIEKLQFVWDNLVSVIKRTAEVIEPVIDFFREHDELSKSLAIAIGVVAGAILIYNAAIIVGAAATVAFGAALAFVTAPLTLTIIGITALVAAGVYLYRNWDTIKAKAIEIFGGLPEPIQNAIKIVVGVFKTQFEIIKTIIVTAWEVIKAVFTGNWGEIGNIVAGGVGEVASIIKTNFESMLPAISGILDSIKSKFLDMFGSLPAPLQGYLKVVGLVIKTGFDLIKNTVTTVMDVVKAIISGDFQAIPGIIGNGLKAAASIVTNMMNGILNIIKGVGAKLFQVGQDIIQGLINGIKAKAMAGVNAIKDVASNMYQGVKNFFVVRSPSRLMKELGVNIVDGLIVGIKDKESDAYKAAVSVANAVLDGIASTRKSIALFGNDSAVSAFDYDVIIGKYDDIAPSLREQYRADLLKLEQMQKEEQARSKISATITDRAAKFQTDQKASEDAFGGLEVNGPQTEAEKMRLAYENKMAIVDKYEQMHTDKKAQAENARLNLTENYNQSIRDLELQKQAQTVGSVAAMFGMALGESSRGYKAMFAIQKAYDFASAQSASFKAIGQAWGSAPFPANLPAVATTTLQTGLIPAAIQALAPKGFKQGGYTGNGGVSDVAGMVHGREFVAHADATRKYRPELESMNKGTYDRNASAAPNINVSVTVQSNGQSSVESDQKIGREMGHAISTAVKQQLVKEKRQGGLLYG